MLYIYPRYFQDNISSVLHKLAPGQWYKNLEQDLKKNNITTIGHLANLDVKTVVQLKIKPPKVQTVKIVLAAYHNKIKKEENTFRKGTPVQEETSQEEEERIKEALFSNPTPSPDKDMTGDQDTASEAKEKQPIDITEAATEAVTDAVTEEAVIEKEDSNVDEGVEFVEEDKLAQETSGKVETPTEQANAILAEESPEDNNSTPQEGSVNFIPETESFSPVKVNSNEASDEGNNCDENEGGLVKPSFVVEEMEVGVKDIEEAETIEKPVETEQDEETAAKIGKDEEKKEQDIDTDAKEGEKNEDTPDQEKEKIKEGSVSHSTHEKKDIMAVMNDTELDLSSQSTKDLIELYERISSHQKEVDQFKDNISKILFARMK